jgi:hypothetical protein
MAQKGEGFEMNGRVFRGGVPYSVDVRRLTEAFPVASLIEGRVIQHADLELIVNAPRGTQRYYAVINSWRIQTKNSNGIFIAWEPGTGIKILAPADVLDHAETKTRQKIRQTGRAIGIFGYVDRNRLNPIGQQRLDHQLRVTTAVKDALRAARKDMSINLAPVASLPKPQLLRPGA